MQDTYNRTIDYMRISITDRCNLRCRYCMPDGISLVPMEEILTYEEIETVCRAAAALGITRFKITGGEPLLRLGCAELVGKLKKISGIQQVTLTTNGVLLGNYLQELLDNGLDGVNISLDSLEPETYHKITGYNGLNQVLKSIHMALESGLNVKINAIMQKNINDKECLHLAELTQNNPLDVRFIEMMPIGYGKQYETIYNEDILTRLKANYPKLEKDEQIHGNGPAVYYRIPAAKGSIGFISAIHGQFCNSCNRIRLTSQGEIKPCLCFKDSINLKELLRGTSTDIEKLLQEAILQAVQIKPKNHCFETYGKITEQKQMVQIGG